MWVRRLVLVAAVAGLARGLDDPDDLTSLRAHIDALGAPDGIEALEARVDAIAERLAPSAPEAVAELLVAWGDVLDERFHWRVPAAANLARAAGILDDVGEPLKAAAVHVSAGLLMVDAARHGDASEAFAAAESLLANVDARASGRATLLATVLFGRTHIRLSDALEQRDLGAAVALAVDLERCSELLAPSAEHRTVARVLLDRAIVEQCMGRDGVADAHLAAADVALGRDPRPSDPAILAASRGKVILLRGQYAPALDALQDASLRFLEDGDVGSALPPLVNVLLVLRALGRGDEAIERWRAIEGVGTAVGGEAFLATGWTVIGAIHFDADRLDEAAEALGRARDIHRVGGDAGRLRDVHVRLALVAQEAQDHDRALAELDLAEAAVRGEGPSPEAVRLVRTRAEVLTSAGRLVEADAALRAAAAGADELGAHLGPLDRGKLQLARAAWALSAGRFRDGLDAALAAQAALPGSAVRDQARAALLSASLHGKRAEFAEALAESTRAAKLHEGLGSRRGRADVAFARGGILQSMGDRARAAGAYREAIDLYSHLGLDVLAVDARLNQVQVVWDASDRAARARVRDELIGFLDEVCERAAADPGRLARSRGLQGKLLLDLGAAEDAAAALQQALAYYDAVGHRSSAASVRIDLGWAKHRSGRSDEGLALLEQAAGVLAELRDDARLASAHHVLAWIHLERGDAATALLHEARSAEHRARVAQEHVLELGSELSMSYREAARELPVFALASLAMLEGSDPLVWETAVARAYGILQNFKGRGMSAQLAERGRGPFDHLPSGEAAQPRETWLANRREAAECTAQLVGLASPPIKMTRDDWHAWQRAVEGQRAELHGRLDTLDAERRELEETARSAHRAYADLVYSRPAALDDVAGLLEPGVALLEYAVAEAPLDGRALAGVFVVTAEDVDYVRLAEPTVWTPTVDRVVDALSRGLRLDHALLRELGDAIVGPALERLAGRGVDTLLVAPDGVLCRIPFEALVTGSADAAPPAPYLVASHAVGYVHSGTVLRDMLAAREDRPTGGRLPSFVGIGHVDHGRDGAVTGLAPLPMTGPELCAIAEIVARLGEDTAGLARLAAIRRRLGNDPDRFVAVHEVVEGERFRLLLGDRADEASLKTDDAVASATVLHLATHAQADEEHPQQSFIALAPTRDARGDELEDGLLTVGEILQLPLGAELVVLSACETNAGPVRRFEGVTSLSRVTLAAGAGAVLSTLWVIPDRDAANIMVDFYDSWWREGAGRLAALAIAKRRAIARGVAVSAWSPFTLWDVHTGS